MSEPEPGNASRLMRNRDVPMGQADVTLQQPMSALPPKATLVAEIGTSARGQKNKRTVKRPYRACSRFLDHTVRAGRLRCVPPRSVRFGPIAEHSPKKELASTVRLHAPPFLHRTKRFEGCAHIGHEEDSLLPSREVCAFGVFAVVDEIHIRFFCPTLRRLINFFSKRAHAYGKLDASRVEESACRQIMLRVPVKTRRRDRGIRQPIERDVVENIVATQSFRLAVEDAGD